MAFKSISLTVITLVISLNSNAATITQTFSTTVSFGEFAGASGTGSFTYDPVNISDLSVSDESCTSCISADTGLEISLTIFGQSFSELDSDSSGIFPFLQFDSSEVDATPVALDFIIQETNVFFPEDGDEGLNLTNITQDGVLGIWITDLSTGSDGFDFKATSFVNESVSAVPVPAAVWLFGSGLLGLIGVARRKTK